MLVGKKISSCNIGLPRILQEPRGNTVDGDTRRMAQDRRPLLHRRGWLSLRGGPTERVDQIQRLSGKKITKWHRPIISSERQAPELLTVPWHLNVTCV